MRLQVNELFTTNFKSIAPYEMARKRQKPVECEDYVEKRMEWTEKLACKSNGKNLFSRRSVECLFLFSLFFFF